VARPRSAYLPWVKSPEAYYLHTMIKVGMNGVTTGWASWSHVGPVGRLEEPVRVDYTGESLWPALDAMEDVLLSMLKQVRRQRDLRAALDEK
jgi:hypothetical protein